MSKTPIWWGGETRTPTPDELLFAETLHPSVPGLSFWLHSDGSGPWTCVSHDVVSESGGISYTLRLDFDGASIVGGISPSSLNWDSGLRALDAGIHGTRQGEVLATSDDVVELAETATSWFSRHMVNHRGKDQ